MDNPKANYFRDSTHLIFLEWFNFLIARNLTYMILIREKQGPHNMTRLFRVYSAFIPRLFRVYSIRGGTINATRQTPDILQCLRTDTQEFQGFK